MDINLGILILFGTPSKIGLIIWCHIERKIWWVLFACVCVVYMSVCVSVFVSVFASVCLKKDMSNRCCLCVRACVCILETPFQT